MFPNKNCGALSVEDKLEEKCGEGRGAEEALDLVKDKIRTSCVEGRGAEEDAELESILLQFFWIEP